MVSRALRVIVINDVYSFDKAGVGRGGFAAAVTLVAQLRENRSDTIVLLAGDFLSGSSLAVRSRGAAAIDVVERLGLDAVVLGNHEFDFGWQRLEELRERSGVGCWLGANVWKNEGKDLLRGIEAERVITTPNGIRVGIFGVCTRATPTLSNPGEGVDFSDEVAAAKACTERLQAQDVDLIVALTHVTAAQDRAIVKAVPGIDLVVGGHDHDPLAHLVHDKLIFKCGQNAYWVGTVDIELPHGRDAQADFQWAMHSTTRVEEDAECLRIIEETKRKLDSEEHGEVDLDEIVATLSAELDCRTGELRRHEASGGTLVADSLLYYYRHHGTDPDLALINGGFIRGDKLYPAGTQLRRRDVYDEMPFQRASVCIEISGEHLISAIQQQMRMAPEPSGSFPHFSDGVRIEYDLSRSPDKRIVAFHLNGEPLNLSRKYRLCCTEFNALGGDGCSSFSFGRQVDAHLSLRIADVLLFYLSKQGHVAPSAPGRSVQVSRSEAA